MLTTDNILFQLQEIKDAIIENKLFTSGVLIERLICHLEDDKEEENEEEEDEEEEENNVYEDAFEREIEKNAELREENRDLSNTIEKLSNHLKNLLKDDHVFNFYGTAALLQAEGLATLEELEKSRGKGK